MFMIVMVMVFGLMVAGIIGAGLIVLQHLLKKREKADTMESIRTIVIPAMEEMTLDMMDKSMDMIPDKSVVMLKKMLKAQQEFEESRYD